MAAIQKNSPLSGFVPDYSSYTLSLIKYCSLNNLIPESRLKEIMDGIFVEFAEIAEQYTRRESSTVSKAIGERLYTGALYHFDVYLITLNSHERAVGELTSKPTWEIFESGRRLIDFIDKDNCRIFKSAYKNRLNSQNPYYRHVMDRAFDEHRKNYCARFAPKNLGTSLGYPLLNNRQREISVPGILYVRSYYTYLGYENEFCRLFDDDELTRLEAAARKQGISSAMGNISQLAANNFFSNLLLDRNEPALTLSADDITKLDALAAVLHEDSLIYTLKTRFAPFASRFSSDKSFKYYFDYIPAFIRTLKRHGAGDTATDFR